MKISVFAPVFLAVVFLLARCGGDPKTAAKTSTFNEEEYLEKGKTMTAAAFMALSSRLKGAIEAKGVSGAVEYCNIAAMPIVDSLSKAYNANIRRTSLRVRNASNAPENWEKGILAEYEAQHQNGQEMKPAVKELDENTIAFTAPIVMMPLCLKCHGGIGTDITAADYMTIKKLYPDDEAFGFADRQLRGMWSITFNK